MISIIIKILYDTRRERYTKLHKNPRVSRNRTAIVNMYGAWDSV